MSPRPSENYEVFCHTPYLCRGLYYPVLCWHTLDNSLSHPKANISPEIGRWHFRVECPLPTGSMGLGLFIYMNPWSFYGNQVGISKYTILENKLRLISINFTPKTIHFRCPKRWYEILCFPGYTDIPIEIWEEGHGSRNRKALRSWLASC